LYQVALVTFEVAAEVHPGGHAHVRVPYLVGYPGNGKIRLVEECGNRTAKSVRNRPR